MIIIPSDFQNNPFVDKKFRELVEFFQSLEEALEYPNCEDVADAKRILARAQNELIMWGIL